MATDTSSKAPAEQFDVIVVGSGAAGMMAGLRAGEQGLSTLIIEGASKYGGTSATSGGALWVPNHGLGEVEDSRELAMTYLEAIVGDDVRRDRLAAYVDTGPEVVRYLVDKGIELYVVPGYPDYYSRAEGAISGRALLSKEIDGGELGKNFHALREQFPRFKLFNRYAFDIDQGYAISSRAPGWQKVLMKMFARYWSDVSWRKITARDRRLTMGAALMGGLYRRVQKLGIEIRLDTTLQRFITEGRRVGGVEVRHFGRKQVLGARCGVIVCAGGFEWSQPMRDRYFEFPTSTRWSSTPEEGNKGMATLAAQEIGAATEFMDCGWWAPTMMMPIKGVSNMESTHQAIFDVGRPHCICVNRNGERFVDESCGYDEFGLGMLADQRKSGANLPCWAIFDVRHRNKYTCGGLLPTALMPDRKIPVDWWDHYVFKSDTIDGLAEKIDIEPARLRETVRKVNEFAKTGVDPEFGRGDNDYDRFFGDPIVSPNPCLGGIEKGPFYAVPINLGDLGTKGGLKADCDGCVLDLEGRAISGLYAAGNASGSVFGDCYPGAGATIGPALVFGYRAANHIAQNYERIQ